MRWSTPVPPPPTAGHYASLFQHAVDVLLVLFFVRLLVAILCHPRMLMPRYGRVHRLLGLLLLAYLCIGLFDARRALLPRAGVVVYDACLSLLGLAVSYSAAREFKSHSRVKNEASGVLDVEATVTVAEMLEHCFYQLLNLCQVLYLHLLLLTTAPVVRAGLAFTVVLPWTWRSRFPVNSFSANYKTAGVGGKSVVIRFLYRMKKWQYLLYKHALLHGLNASLAFARTEPADGGGAPPSALVHAAHFRLYWLCLNTAYVCEFFMQTLVKRGFMSQAWMLALQQLLMSVSTVAALRVLANVWPHVAALSFALNFVRRGHEVSNGALVLAAAGCTRWLLG